MKEKKKKRPERNGPLGNKRSGKDAGFSGILPFSNIKNCLKKVKLIVDMDIPF